MESYEARALRLEAEAEALKQERRYRLAYLRLRQASAARRLAWTEWASHREIATRTPRRR